VAGKTKRKLSYLKSLLVKGLERKEGLCNELYGLARKHGALDISGDESDALLLLKEEAEEHFRKAKALATAEGDEYDRLRKTIGRIILCNKALDCSLTLLLSIVSRKPDQGVDRV
jgi:hypothetical protein